MFSNWLDKILGFRWFRRSLAIAVLLFTFKLTNWGASYAWTAFQMIMEGKPVDLLGVAGIITAVAAIPNLLLAYVFTKYDEKRVNDKLEN